MRRGLAFLGFAPGIYCHTHDCSVFPAANYNSVLLYEIWFFLRRRPVIPRGRLSRQSITTEENSRESSAILKTVVVIGLIFLFLLLLTQIAWMLLDFKNVSFDEL